MTGNFAFLQVQNTKYCFFENTKVANKEQICKNRSVISIQLSTKCENGCWLSKNNFNNYKRIHPQLIDNCTLVITPSLPLPPAHRLSCPNAQTRNNWSMRNKQGALLLISCRHFVKELIRPIMIVPLNVYFCCCERAGQEAKKAL